MTPRRPQKNRPLRTSPAKSRSAGDGSQRPQKNRPPRTSPAKSRSAEEGSQRPRKSRPLRTSPAKSRSAGDGSQRPQKNRPLRTSPAKSRSAGDGSQRLRKSRPPRTSPAKPRSAEDGSQRLQKVLAAAGLGSRRQCEELITTGRVDVDRQVVTELGTRADPAKQLIRVDGVALPTARLEYFAVNKPSGVLCTNSDPSGRPRVVDLVPSRGARLFTIGRLDLHSDGLILVTNDGELANRLTHPRYGVSKTYRVTVAGQPSRDILRKLEQGVHLAEGFARAEHMSIKSHRKDSTVLEMVLREGKNREIRRLLARVGHKVLRLTRTAIGPVRLGSLSTGEVRRLTSAELKALRREGNKG